MRYILKALFLSIFIGITHLSFSQTNTFPGSGNVGIGTTSPNSPLQIGSSGATTNQYIKIIGKKDAGIKLIADDNNSGEDDNAYVSFSQDDALAKSVIGHVGYAGKDPLNGTYSSTSGNALLIGTTTNHRVQLGTNQEVRVTVTGDGKVGIGTTSVPSGYKLAVQGKVIVEEIKVELNAQWWPDYVFTDGYELPSLDQVEDYIEENQHLPGILSQQEVAEDGIMVGEMQGKLLQKIEELTLHMIDLKKENDLLKQRVTQLETGNH